MKNKDEIAMEPVTRLTTWMKERNLSSQGLADKSGYARGSIDAIRQRKRELSRKFAVKISEVDAELEANPDKRIRWEYLICADDYRTREDLNDAVMLAALDEAEKEWAQEAAVRWMFQEAGYEAEKLPPTKTGERQYRLYEEGKNEPLRLIPAADIQELQNTLVDYTRFLIERYLKRKEAAEGVDTIK